MFICGTNKYTNNMLNVFNNHKLQFKKKNEFGIVENCIRTKIK